MTRHARRQALLAHAHALQLLLGPLWLLDVLAIGAALAGAVILLAAIDGEPWPSWAVAPQRGTE